MKIREILKNKGPQVFSIGEELTASEAIRLLALNSIGVLIVLSAESKIVGILSERDIIRQCYSNPDMFQRKQIKDIMTKKVIFAEPNDEIEYLESLMTQNKIRHVPILDNGVLVGLISLGDIVNALLTGSRVENKYLMDYISGNIA
ncbi:MAG: CBS domain-containing protein [Candidatus Kapabacteria bacterium]|nr:CBS domain-containing protein [Candidatus Kapabacteria bacterium]